MTTMHVITGPSGTGKSTFAAQQPDWTPVWNLDDIEAAGYDRDTSLSLMDREIREAIAHRDDDVIDHIVDTEAINAWITPARDAGYTITAWLLANDDPELHVARVAQRQADGGHGAPPDIVRALHTHALGGFPELALIAHQSVLIDTADLAPRPIALIEGFEASLQACPIPQWAEEITGGFITSTVNVPAVPEPNAPERPAPRAALSY